MAAQKEATWSRLARLHFGLGRTLAALDAPGLAALAFRDAVRAEPRLAPAHFALGEVLGRKGRWGEAAAAYAAAARLRGDTEYQGNLVYALGRAFLWRDALRACDRFGELRAEDADVLLLRGLILRRLGRANEAILAFRRAAQLPAPATGRRFCLGEALFGVEAWLSAVAALSQARGIGPADAFGSRLNAAPAPWKVVPRPRRAAFGRRRFAGIAQLLARAQGGGVRAARHSWRWFVRNLGRGALLLALPLRREPHHALRALRAERRLDALG